ncbi:MULTISPECIES: DUF721 domain-containing protein [unclassified Treponema]|uniref:DUF721 domain-containing protein n=1 Tax=unclassified Treponema TaxID=2638727 RepID=UPI0020A544B3|nr:MULTISPECIES: DUF721 domain-containing protein [unclassified Treponema]UTC66764.1 DUF721 domain-containing protein [Treponema sp. OMZ 789]UTC69497.1 DUF721 domain-containing protein [Treponema sp. OMZ 790]UTC72211.1 DUF721 domain-containing protein [Treponema sp. OMZ 791]
MKLFKTSKEIVDNFSQKFNEMLELASNLDGEQALSVYESWEKVIGDQKLASYCELYDIKNDTVIIKTEHTGWSQQLLMRKKKIIYNFKKFYPALGIQNISVFVETEFDLKKKADVSENLRNGLTTDIEEDSQKSAAEPDKNLPPELAKALKSLKKAILKKNK